tara:strand:- start:365 stop:838 length:474 start_codon:yes stop_codon:yes gene_type:complete
MKKEYKPLLDRLNESRNKYQQLTGTPNKTILKEEKQGGKAPPADDCCIKWKWVSNDQTAGGWFCVKEKPDCPASGVVIPLDPVLAGIETFNNGIDDKVQMKEDILNERPEPMCCDCWELSGIGSGWVNNGDGRWRCCGHRPCTKMFGKAQYPTGMEG